MEHLNDMIGMSQHARELKKWDLPMRQGGMRPDVPLEYPRMAYKATKNAVGKAVVDDSLECQRIARDAEEYARMVADGWCESPKLALDAFELEQQAIGQAAAERAYSDRRMSPMAQREAAEADAQSKGHLPEVPEQRRGPGRPKTLNTAPA